jgi:hypothetical protein
MKTLVPGRNRARSDYGSVALFMSQCDDRGEFRGAKGDFGAAIFVGKLEKSMGCVVQSVTSMAWNGFFAKPNAINVNQ